MKSFVAANNSRLNATSDANNTDRMQRIGEKLNRITVSLNIFILYLFYSI